MSGSMLLLTGHFANKKGTALIRIKLLTAIIAIAACSSAYGLQYTFTDLGVVPDGFQSAALAINNSGDSVGYSYVGNPSSISSSSSRATLWSNGSPTNLGSALTGSVATAINDANVVVGWSTSSGFTEVSQATVWSGGSTTVLSSLGGTSTAAYSINNNGVIAGWARTAGVGGTHAITWSNGVASDLGTLAGGTVSFAYAINDDGVVVGTSDSASTGYRATLWNQGSVLQLGSLAGNYGSALSINNKGQIVGVADDGQNGNRAILWALDGSLIDLGTLGGDTAIAYDVNNYGDIVGGSTLANSYSAVATLWRSGEIIDLNSLLDPLVASNWFLHNAASINDSGLIVGEAENLTTGVAHAFLLTPDSTSVPEPETLAMFLAGLGLIGLIASRRKKVLMHR